MPSESNPTGAYIVSADADFQNLRCYCPAWIHHTPRTNCKHIQRLLRERRTTPTFVTSNQFATITPAEKLQQTSASLPT